MSQETVVVPAAEFGAECLRVLLKSVERVAAPMVGLPTGNTPIPLYRELEAAVRAGLLDISNWRPAAIDEYGGPRNHSCSNRAFFERYWDVIPGAAPVLQFDPEAPDPEAGCRRMAEQLALAGGLDTAILGIGMNGHLAFNEPGSVRESLARRVELHDASRVSARGCWGEETPTWGLTLGLHELLGARSVLVFANGSAKAEIVGRALQEPPTLECPASLTRTLAKATWVLDTEAASNLRKRSNA